MKKVHSFYYTNYEACKKRRDEYPFRYGEHHRCPYYLKDSGTCFEYCDLESSDMCGNCVNLIPLIRVDGSRTGGGTCFHHVGVIGGGMRTSCPFYVKRKSTDMFADEWIEKRVEELCDFDRYAPEARPSRKQAIEEWLDAHPIQQDRIKSDGR